MTDSSADGSGGTGGSLWGGRFQDPMDPAMVPLNRSLDVDWRIWRQDIRVSLAWVSALVGANVLTADEGKALGDGLTTVAKRLESESLSHAPEEDIHTLVERLLQEEVGPVAGKLQTGRSRNDQVSTGFRLWGIETARELDNVLTHVTGSLTVVVCSPEDPPGHGQKPRVHAALRGLRALDVGRGAAG